MSFMKLHFISSIICAVLITLMAINHDEFTRYVYLVPILISFFMTTVLFAIEYDKNMVKRFKIMKKTAESDAYAKFVSEYYSDKKTNRKIRAA